jgi:predicted PurR-regulated permease PerM
MNRRPRGLDPVVRWLISKGLPRWAAVLIVLLALLCVIAGFIAAAVPPLASQTSALIHELPRYMHQLQAPEPSHPLRSRPWQ